MISVFLSDIHIGSGAATDRFQKTVHQDCLKAVLKYITNRAAQIKDVVILGDWFEQWVYPASGSVPGINDILACNKELFISPDGSGDFVSCLDNIQGGFYYVNGNHDMTVSCDDINAFIGKYSKSGRRILGNSDPAANVSYNSGIVYGAHGHLQSLTCSPYNNKENLYKPLPIGYYMSRTQADICRIKLKEKKVPNSAYLERSGSPILSQDNLMHSMDYIKAFLHEEITAAQAILYTLVRMAGTGNPSRYSYRMEDSFISAVRAAGMYSGLSIPNSLQGLAVDIFNDLGDTAEKICRQSPRIVIFGHTHEPLLKQVYTPNWVSLYANTGFFCADIPGMKSKKLLLTFVEVEEHGGGYTVRLKKVDYPSTVISTCMKCSIRV